MPDFEDIKGKLKQSLADIDRSVAEFVEPFSKPIDPPSGPSMWTGADFKPLSRSFLDEHRIPSRPKHYQLTADEAFPIDLPENYAGRLRYYVPVSIRKVLGRQALSKSLGDSIVAAVRAQSGERNRTKYEAIKALLGGRRDQQDDRDSRECALFAMLGYRATPDFVVDASRAMTMEQLIEDIFDMRGRGTDFQLTVDLLTPGRAIYMEEFRGRQAEFLRGVEFRNSVMLPLFRAEAVIIKEVVLVAFLGRVFQLTGEALLEFLGFLARTRGGAAVIETLAAELRAFLLSAQLRIGPVVGDAVLLIAEIGRVVAVVLLTVLQYLLMVVHIAQTLVEAIPAVGGMVNAAFELFLGALDALIDLIEADEMLEQAGLVANAGVPESDDPTMTEFLAAWSEPLPE